MLAKEFVDRLERLGLLDQEIIEALRQQLAEGGSRITPEAVAKLLVDNGQLTHFQATKLIGELRSNQYQGDEPAEAVDLGLASEPDPDSDSADAIEVVQADPVVEVVAVEAVNTVAATESAVASSIDQADSGSAGRPKPARRKPDPKKSVWDSFKVYGYLGIIALLILVGGGIFWVLTREGADEVIKNANKLYDQQNYDAAQKAYIDFSEDYPDSQHRSLSDVRIVMTELYKAAAFRQEPWRAVDLAKQRLPEVANETGMNAERANLAQLLVDIAKSLAAAAARTTETDKKQSLLSKLNEHGELMENPLYVSGTMRANLANQIQEVEESRQRVQRDIDRNIMLDESEKSMASMLDEKKTKPAYDVRKSLLRDFPELKDHQRIVKLIHRASDIQQTLVAASPKLPKVFSDARPSKSLSTIVLTTLVGETASDLRDETLYLRAGGSIMAFEGSSGELKWRRFVGYAKDLPPVRLAGQEGVLLSESSTLEVIRCGSEEGAIQWRAGIEETFSLPVSTGREVYVATQSGRLIKMDAETGDSNWAAQVPQSFETGPGVDRRAGRAYIPGDHSNLYVLDSADGSCVQSYYIGHEPGTVIVPPVPLLGHVFVIENAGVDFANVHVLSVDKDDGTLTLAQPPFRLTGNVRIKPIIQGRRLIVLTDRGEGIVYDVEPTAETERVTEAATLSPSYNQPTATQMAVSKSQMWITGTRIARYELQINTGNIVSGWTQHDGDAFIGQPLAKDDTLVYARILRGTSAIRVTAADAKSGDEIWHTDVGVPIAMLRQLSDGKGIHVVTSQAALYQLDRQAIISGSTTGPIENPGDELVAKSFADPIVVDQQRAVMLNRVDGKSMVVYDAGREREQLRSVTMSLSAGRPSGGGLAVNDSVLVPLDIGRIELIDFRTGASKATPFQPEAKPNDKIAWTNPVALPDDPSQVILANDRKQIYRLRVSEQIRELASKELEYAFLGRAAGLGGMWISASAGKSADYLVGFEMATLTEKFKILLDGRVVWGPEPFQVGNEPLCLIQTDDQQLHGFGPDGKPLFSVAVPEGIPAGPPVVSGGLIVLAGQPGWLVTIDPQAGEIVGQTDLQQPVSASPFLIGKSLLVPGKEGVIYIVKIPTD